jgi:hypothetical protein
MLLPAASFRDQDQAGFCVVSYLLEFIFGWSPNNRMLMLQFIGLLKVKLPTMYSVFLVLNYLIIEHSVQIVFLT